MEDIPYELIADQILRGKVVPFLGAGASIFHARDAPNTRPPSGTELSDALASLGKFPKSTDERDYPCALELDESGVSGSIEGKCTRSDRFLRLLRAERPELARAASYLESEHAGRPTLNDCLHRCFPDGHEPNSLHHLLAAIAEKGVSLLVITTNYDDLVERAFQARSIKYHLIATRLEVTDKGPFSVFHRKPEGEMLCCRPLEVQVPDGQHPIIFKMHGTIDRSDPPVHSYIVTEDDYVSFLLFRPDNVVPNAIARRVQNCNLLFLGYGLRDWNFRVLLAAWCRSQRGSMPRGWAVQEHPSPVDRSIWRTRNVSIYSADLADFVTQLRQTLAQTGVAL